jgi:AraC-like DNA-binding protein
MAPPYYREYPLRPPLDALVECVWFLRGRSVTDAAATPQCIPPDGTVELIVHLAGRFEEVASGIGVPQPPVLVVGVWTGPIALSSPRRFDSVGIRIRPGCAASFWDEPASRITDRAVDAADLLGPDAGRLRDRLGDACDESARLRIVTSFLLERLRERRPLTRTSIARVVAAGGRISIDALARGAGVSARHLERVFRTEVGVSPKMFSRIIRFQRVLRMGEPERSWAEVASRCGYADQAHLIRDFAQFAGSTPAVLASSEPELADYFRRR